MRPFFRNKLLIMLPAVVAFASWSVGSNPRPLLGLLVMFAFATIAAMVIHARMGFNYLYPGSLMVLPSLVFFWGSLPRIMASLNWPYSDILGFAFFLHLLFIFRQTRLDIATKASLARLKRPNKPKRKTPPR